MLESQAIDFIKNHQEEDICIYWEPAPKLGGIRLTMRRNSRVLHKVFSYQEVYDMTLWPAKDFLEEMYDEFDRLNTRRTEK